MARLDTRTRMVLSAAQLIREHGAAGTSIDRVLAHSGAPRGSVYHHFPGGREQLVEEATRFAGDYLAGVLAGAEDATSALAEFVGWWRQQLRDSDFRAGCPVLAVAIESPEAPGPAAAVAEVFAAWTDQLARLLRRQGVSRVRANDLATYLISAVEGAVVLAQVQRSTRPLDVTAKELRRLLEGLR